MIFSSVCFIFLIEKLLSPSGTFQIIRGPVFRDQVKGEQGSRSKFTIIRQLGARSQSPDCAESLSESWRGDAQGHAAESQKRPLSQLRTGGLSQRRKPGPPACDRSRQ